MTSELEYIKNAMNTFNKAFGDLFLRAATNDFRDVRLKNKVKGLKLSQFAEEYKRLLERAEENSRRLTHKFIDDTRVIKDFERQNESKLNQIYNCARCKCIECIVENCCFSSCGSCRRNSYVFSCDRHEVCQITVQDTLTLYCDEINDDVEFDILSIIELENSKCYILLQEREDEDNKQMFIIKDTLEGITYEPIENEEELEKIADIYMES